MILPTEIFDFLTFGLFFKWETKVEKSKEDFEQISKTIKEEVKRFDLVRANEFRIELTSYIEKLYHNQENVSWGFLIFNEFKC